MDNASACLGDSLCDGKFDCHSKSRSGAVRGGRAEMNWRGVRERGCALRALELANGQEHPEA